MIYGRNEWSYVLIFVLLCFAVKIKLKHFALSCDFSWQFFYVLFAVGVYFYCLLFLFQFILSVFFLYSSLTRDLRQPLSQIRLSVSMSLGAGQTIFLAGINATESKVSCLTFCLWDELTLCTVILSIEVWLKFDKDISLHRLSVY